MRVMPGDALVEVSRGVGPDWEQYPLLGATREGVAPAKEPVGKSPERYKLVDRGTIFYNPMRILIGSIAMIDEGDTPGITSPDYVVFKTRPGVLHHRCFYFWLRSAVGEDFIRRLARGAVRERMLFRRLAEAEIVVPPWPAQVRLAVQLKAANRARAAAEEQLAATRELVASYLRMTFSDDMAGDWPRHRLGEFLQLRQEIVHPRHHPIGSAKFVGLEHIESGTGRRIGNLDVDLATLTGRKPRFMAGDLV